MKATTQQVFHVSVQCHQFEKKPTLVTSHVALLIGIRAVDYRCLKAVKFSFSSFKRRLTNEAAGAGEFVHSGLDRQFMRRIAIHSF